VTVAKHNATDVGIDHKPAADKTGSEAEFEPELSAFAIIIHSTKKLPASPPHYGEG